LHRYNLGSSATARFALL